MKNRASVYLCFLLTACLGLSACGTVHVQGPEVPVPNAKPKLQEAKRAFSPKKLSSGDIPEALGGIVQSDSWVIYKEKQQEEFTGHVSYDNGAYTFRADYALSDRARNTFSARGHVFLRQQNKDGSYYEGSANRASYNYRTQKGELTGTGKEPARLVYHNVKGETLIATAQKITFDLEQKIYILQKNVYIERPAAQGPQTITAQKATIKQLEEYALLEGTVTVKDAQRTLQAKTITYDGKNNISYAQGERVLAQGTTEQGTFAIIADKVQSDNEGKQIHLDGQVQGWLVSPKINESKINQKF